MEMACAEYEFRVVYGSYTVHPGYKEMLQVKTEARVVSLDSALYFVPLLDTFLLLFTSIRPC